jgi:outer membrane protein OmpA-like peptidoglycan-associated protein
LNSLNNLQLSLKRVESAAKYLIEMGIDTDRIEMAGNSFSYPLESNETEEGRKTNRRVDFIIVTK